MDTVPLDFSQRVLATCELQRFCDHSLFITPKWSQTEGTKNQRLMLYIGFVDGKWKHGFCDYVPQTDDLLLSLEDLVKLPNVKNHVKICCVGLIAAGIHPDRWNHDVVDMQKLLKVVSFLSNEPELHLGYAGSLDLPGGELLSAWLQDTSFSRIQIVTLTSDRIYRTVLEKQFSGRKPTAITVNQIHGNEQFLAELLMSGDLRNFLLIFDRNFKFPWAVLERIVRNVMSDPDDYRKNKLDIQGFFETPTKELLDELTRNAEHSIQFLPYHEEQQTTYKFIKQSLILQRTHDFWRLKSDR